MNIPSWKIVADENIPFVRELFEVFGKVSLLKGRDISAADLDDADILLVRSVTQVNQSLLENSKIKFVGTCTIGTDHLDKAWLESHGIAWASAPGCNAMGVVQYVLSCLAVFDLLEQKNKIAVVGCGNVGGRLYRTLKMLGNDCVCIDPFKDKNQLPDLADFNKIFDCNIVCLHTPLTKAGDFPTYHLINKDVLPRLRPGCLLLNAGRGPVIDNLALLDFLKDGGDLKVVLDVWEPEPDINRELFERISLGTPHIAGYSFEGKINGSLMIFDALCKYAGCQHLDVVQNIKQAVSESAFGEAEEIAAGSFSATLLRTYDVRLDHENLQSQLSGLPATFDSLRKNYPVRREPGHYYLQENDFAKNQIDAIGFREKS